MKVVFTHVNGLIVANVQNILTINRIKSTLLNQYASGGSGELSAIDSWPELWVKETDYQAAIAIIKPLNEPTQQYPWRCNNCGEENESSFDFCWNCQEYL